MNSEMQKRLYEIEITPPQAVWEKLSITIDEINADNLIAKKILISETIPPSGIWEKINSAINPVEVKEPQKKAVVINLRKLALAAILIGIIVTAWVLFRNSNETSAGLVVDNPTENKTVTDSNTRQQEVNEVIQNDKNVTSPTLSIAAATPINRPKRKSTALRANNLTGSGSGKASFASLNTQRVGKNFDLPIDDLSSVTSDQHYLTMVNGNGRLVKIPTQLVSLASHLQDKPVSEDIYEVMFGEGAYWKETLNEWRKKVASASISPGDAFTSFLELLKSVQDK